MGARVPPTLVPVLAYRGIPVLDTQGANTSGSQCPLGAQHLRMGCPNPVGPGAQHWWVVLVLRACATRGSQCPSPMGPCAQHRWVPVPNADASWCVMPKCDGPSARGVQCWRVLVMPSTNRSQCGWVLSSQCQGRPMGAGPNARGVQHPQTLVPNAWGAQCPRVPAPVGPSTSGSQYLMPRGVPNTNGSRCPT